jgi:hypothetical protein
MICQGLLTLRQVRRAAAGFNFQLVADELETRLGFKRHRQSVAA